MGAAAMPVSERPRLVVGISGASGIVYGLRVLDACRDLGVESHLIMSRAADEIGRASCRERVSVLV